MSEPIPRVLVIDDNEAIHRDFAKVLAAPERHEELDELESELFGLKPRESHRREYDLETASQGLDGVDVAKLAKEEGRPFSVAFIDMRMPPGIDGLETIERLWKVDPDVEVVICSAYSDYTWDEIAGRLGHSDRWLLLRKPFDTTEVLQLAAALAEKWRLRQHAGMSMAELSGMVESRTRELEVEIAEREAAHEALAKSALTDPLTGLSNRAVAMERMREACRGLSTRPGSSFAVLFLDLDNFKMINDSHGHDAGDRVLAEVAVRGLEVLSPVLGSASHAERAIFRIGGDEFVVLLDELDNPSKAEQIADDLLKRISDPIDVDGREIVVGLSIGMSIGGQDFHRAEEVLSAADAAMYHAKRLGRGRLERFGGPLFEETRERALIAEELRHAVDNDSITLVYEPIFNTVTGEIMSFEALARWKHPSGEFIPPAKFIPIAEETGLIVPLGEKILDQACRDLLFFHEDIDELMPTNINVNFSKRQLVEPGIASRVAALTAAAGLDPNRLNVEVTESAIMDGPDTLRKVIDSLQALGTGVHMDDFGTGLSSLSYLQRFPFETIKIDRSFVSTMETNERDAAIVRAILTMARELGMEVIAEGVEKKAQADELTGLRCEYLQGHLLSRPLSRLAAKALLGDVRRYLELRRKAA